MGAGIAQLACLAGSRTLLHDPVPEALERGMERIREGLRKGSERGRWTPEEAAEAEARVEPCASLADLADAELVIEAAPERPELKRELFAAISAAAPGAVIATNTSSIPITELAGAAARPEQVVGMHFFNPAPLMKLVEVIPALQSSETAVALVRATGEAMGKRVIVAADGPGFIVNRCGRPFYTEALRVVQERIATPAQVDRICRMQGGFRMGPFELMDLVGIDVGYEVAQSFMRLSFGEPRWRPNPLQARMAAAGRLGRKSGRGWYDYSGDGPYRPEDPEEPPAEDLGQQPVAVIERIVCQLVNEAYFAMGEGVGSAEDIDAGLKLGLNHPKGPVEWGDELGLHTVLATVDRLFDHYHEERYRAAPLLRTKVEA
jgi:3-hydroxybutyryl-CoA dehydrogenase